VVEVEEHFPLPRSTKGFRPPLVKEIYNPEKSIRMLRRVRWLSPSTTKMRVHILRYGFVVDVSTPREVGDREGAYKAHLDVLELLRAA